jgi:hypothetical protein
VGEQTVTALHPSASQCPGLACNLVRCSTAQCWRQLGACSSTSQHPCWPRCDRLPTCCAVNYAVGNKLGGWAVNKGLVKQEYVAKTGEH